MTQSLSVTLDDGRAVYCPDVAVTIWEPEFSAHPTCGFTTLTVMVGETPIGFITPENFAQLRLKINNSTRYILVYE